MAPDYVLGGFLHKVGLRISWGDEGHVWHRGHQGALGDALFGATKDGVKNRNEKLTALVGKGITKRAICNAGWDGLQADRTGRKRSMERRLSMFGLARKHWKARMIGTLPRTSPASMPPRCFISMTQTTVSRSPFRIAAGWAQTRGRLVKRMDVH